VTAATRRATPGRNGQNGDAPPELGAAIRAALGYLADLTDPPEAVRDGRLDRMLRASVQAHLAGSTSAPRRTDGAGAALDEAAAAVRTACAHLAATELEDAYLALRAAYDRLPRRPGPSADGDAAPLPAT
jgi:hypothetical protein